MAEWVSLASVGCAAKQQPERSDASRFRVRSPNAIIRGRFGRTRPLPDSGEPVTNPVTSTDRVFLKHFSMVIGFLFVVMILFMHTGLVGLFGRGGPVQRLLRLNRAPVEEPR